VDCDGVNLVAVLWIFEGGGDAIGSGGDQYKGFLDLVGRIKYYDVLIILVSFSLATVRYPQDRVFQEIPWEYIVVH